MRRPEEYAAIRIWGAYMHSFRPYVELQQERAADAGAPLDAIFAQHEAAGPGKRWFTMGELAEDHPFREFYRAAVKGSR